MIGSRVSHFRILDQIGAGGMGVVYKALDEDLQRVVALKLLRGEALAAPGRRERFRQEARAASALNHPGIVVVHEVGTDAETDFIAMELIGGQTLRDAIPESGMPLERFLDLATQLAEALERAHSAGILHRDLKPGNVMVTPDERVKVLDFGLAKWLEGANSGPDASTREQGVQTAEGIVVGTPRFMSPEQIDGATLDARSDIFSFGAILYQMLTGQVPFSGTSTAQVQSAILRDAPVPVCRVRPELPPEVERIVAKTLEKDAGFRHRSMGDVISDLRRLGRDSIVPAREATRSGRTSLQTLAAGGVLLAVLGFGLWIGRDTGRPAAPTDFRLISTFPGSHRSPSFSPDGSMIAFTSAVDGVSQVWVSTIAGGEPVRITDVEAHARRPRWSPRNDQIVFASGGDIWSVPPLGGAATRVIEAGRDPNFSPQGDRLVFVRGRDIWVARVDGGDERRLEGIERGFYSAFGQRSPTFSRDGRRIVYFQPASGPAGDLWIIPAAGGAPRRLTNDNEPAGSPVFTTDGRDIIFSSTRGGSMNLWKLALSDGSLTPVTTGSGDDLDPDVSADGRLIYCSLRNSFVLKLLDPQSGREREIIERRTVMAFPRASPDGRHIAFFGASDDTTHIFTAAVDGAEVRQVTSGAAERNIVPRWSSDGKSLYYYQSDSHSSFSKISVEGGTSVVIAPGWDWTHQNGAAVDAGETRVAYTEVEPERGAIATRVRELGTEREIQLGQALWAPQWSADASRILGLTQQGVLTWCPLAPGPCTQLIPGSAPRLGRHDGRIYFASDTRPLDDPALVTMEIASVDAVGADRRSVATLEPVLGIARSFDVSPSGEIAWVQVKPGSSEMWLAEPTGLATARR